MDGGDDVSSVMMTTAIMEAWINVLCCITG